MVVEGTTASAFASGMALCNGQPSRFAVPLPWTFVPSLPTLSFPGSRNMSFGCCADQRLGEGRAHGRTSGAHPCWELRGLRGGWIIDGRTCQLDLTWPLAPVAGRQTGIKLRPRAPFGLSHVSQGLQGPANRPCCCMGISEANRRTQSVVCTYNGCMRSETAGPICL